MRSDNDSLLGEHEMLTKCAVSQVAIATLSIPLEDNIYVHTANIKYIHD